MRASEPGSKARKRSGPVQSADNAQPGRVSELPQAGARRPCARVWFSEHGSRLPLGISPRDGFLLASQTYRPGRGGSNEASFHGVINHEDQSWESRSPQGLRVTALLARGPGSHPERPERRRALHGLSHRAFHTPGGSPPRCFPAARSASQAPARPAGPCSPCGEVQGAA